MKYAFESEPICERWAAHWGKVRLYAPDAPPSQWKDLPWLVETDKGGVSDGPVREKVIASLAYRAFGSPAIIDRTVRFKRHGETFSKGT